MVERKGHSEEEDEEEDTNMGWGEVRAERELNAIRDLIHELEITGDVNTTALWYLQCIMRIRGLERYCASHPQTWEKADTAVQSASAQTTPPPPQPQTHTSSTQTPPRQSPPTTSSVTQTTPHPNAPVNSVTTQTQYVPAPPVRT